MLFICTFATWSVRTTQRKQMWISLSYTDTTNRNKKYRLWNKAPYLCLWLLASLLCSYLLSSYVIWGWTSALFLTSCKAEQKEQLPCEWTEKCHTVIIPFLVSLLWQGQEATQGTKYLARTIFSAVEADHKPWEALEEILSVHSVFWLGRLLLLSCNMQFRQ